MKQFLKILSIFALLFCSAQAWGQAVEGDDDKRKEEVNWLDEVVVHGEYAGNRGGDREDEDREGDEGRGGNERPEEEEEPPPPPPPPPQIPCTALQTLWNNSFSNSFPEGMKETAGFLLANGGYLIFNNSGNTAHNGSFPDGSYGIYDGDGRAYAIMPDGSTELIAGFVHTHPDSDPLRFQGPTIFDDERDDFTILEGINDIYGYVIATDDVYRYYFDNDGNKIIESAGSRDSLSECP